MYIDIYTYLCVSACPLGPPGCGAYLGNEHSCSHPPQDSCCMSLGSRATCTCIYTYMGSSMLDPGSSIEDTGDRILDPGPRIQETASRIQHTIQ